MNEHKLCYVYGNAAYFTSLPLSEQWGDDWDDAPYEHNAEVPYSDQNGQIVKVMWDGPLVPPCDAHYNSPYTVQQINAGVVAWLYSDSWTKDVVAIPAGTTLSEFGRLVRKAGGNVYLREVAQ